MKETELKCIIDEETYKNVKRAFNWESVFVQENHYYTDSAGLLRKNRIMVRVRCVSGVCRLQVKKHKNSESPLQICDESEFCINGVPDTLDAGTALKITGMDAGELKRIGKSVTKRRTVRRESSELCLDKTTYLGKTDYEVELEYAEKMSAELFAKLNMLKVKFDKKSVGKFSRFLKEYKKQTEE